MRDRAGSHVLIKLLKSIFRMVAKKIIVFFLVYFFEDAIREGVRRGVKKGFEPLDEALQAWTNALKRVRETVDTIEARKLAKENE